MTTTGTIKHGQARDTCNIGQRTQNEENKYKKQQKQKNKQQTNKQTNKQQKANKNKHKITKQNNKKANKFYIGHSNINTHTKQ